KATRSKAALPAYQIDDQNAGQRRNDTGNPQCAVGHFQHRGHGAFGSAGKAGETETFDREQQAERGEKVVHRPNRSRSACYFAEPAEPEPPAAAGVVPGNDLPEGSLK